MTVAFIVLSFFVHIVTIGFLVVISKKQKALQKERGNLMNVREDVKGLLETYTNEVKRENEALKQSLQTQTSAPRIYELQQQTQQAAEESDKRPEQQERTDKRENIRENNFSIPNKNEDIEDTEDTYEVSFKAKVLSLANQGYEKGEIAKQLNMGKGEVELLLKFYQ
ncbi:hypothetical protein SAMN05192534_101237 [Alteribacillus persepolensis]|uniref:Swarming motility protein SwrB n=1 Tax=Alteribacillus persepolensis TaxID=568899 RepID=A0A1G7YQZ1_9BACI|nr:hypothetical protein [Alteribacillus persepolensis]SDG98745.1 hypothetical protein SAMN05192534_101237 [Alteribacillus persepolensis]